jgi:hypothetical protein
LTLKLCLWVKSSPKTNMAMKHATPNAASAVTTRWKVRVGSTQMPPMASSTTMDPMKPGVPVMAPVASVNQELAPPKPPAPIPMIRAVIWRLRRTSGTSNAMISTDAMTSVQDSIHPSPGCRMRLVNT